VVIVIDSYDRTHKYILPVKAEVRKKTVTAGILQQELTFDIHQFLKNDTQVWTSTQAQPKHPPFTRPTFRGETVSKQLQFTNFLDQPLLVSRVVTHSPEMTLKPDKASLLEVNSKFTIEPQKTFHYGSLELRTHTLASPTLERFFFL